MSPLALLEIHLVTIFLDLESHLEAKIVQTLWQVQKTFYNIQAVKYLEQVLLRHCVMAGFQVLALNFCSKLAKGLVC